MNKKRIVWGTVCVAVCLVVGGIVYKLYEQHQQLQELLAIVHKHGAGQVAQNIMVPTSVEHVVGKSQVWRPVQEAVKDAVVQIIVQGAELDILQPYATPNQFTTYGTGFFINEDGEIVTNEHVVRNAKQIWIQIPSLGKRIIDAVVVGESPDRDLALLRITDEGRNIIIQELGDIKYLKMGDSDFVRRADEVMALGYPLGQQSLKSTTGVISGREGGMIQISAAINPGNSGGPLMNVDGAVIGINSSKITGSQVDNIGYMIPINDLKITLDDLRNTKLVRKPFLGVLFSNGTEALTEYLGNPVPGGCYVADVVKNSTLYKAGVETGDMIYEINGQKIDVYGEMSVPWSEDRVSLVDYVSRLAIGDDICFVIYRKGKRKEMTVKFTEAELPAVRQVFPWLEQVDYEVFAGMVVMQLSGNHVRALVQQAPGLMFYTDMKHQVEPVLVVTHVFPTSQLYRSRTIIAGATLNDVNGIAVHTLDELRAAFRASDGKNFTIRATDRFTQASDNIFVVLPYNKVLQEEPLLSQLYKYPLSKTAQELLAQCAQAIQKDAVAVAPKNKKVQGVDVQPDHA